MATATSSPDCPACLEIEYPALMTEDYPPFRLDLGDPEPGRAGRQPMKV